MLLAPDRGFVRVTVLKRLNILTNFHIYIISRIVGFDSGNLCQKKAGIIFIIKVL